MLKDYSRKIAHFRREDCGGDMVIMKRKSNGENMNQILKQRIDKEAVYP
jgi:hypothetical protein